MNDRRLDLLMLALAISCPIALIVGVTVLVTGGPTFVATFLLAYGIASVWGCGRLLIEFAMHGIHNDR